MKQHEKDEKIAALTKQIEELKAMPVEPEQPLCVMPGRMEKDSRYWILFPDGSSDSSRDDHDEYDDTRFACGNYFSSERQASTDAHAISVMRLMRRMPGVVGADADGWKFSPNVYSGSVDIFPFDSIACSACMFPCYATEEQARAAIEAVGGEDEIRRCAEYWSGVMK